MMHQIDVTNLIENLFARAEVSKKNLLFLQNFSITIVPMKFFVTLNKPEIPEISNWLTIRIIYREKNYYCFGW